MEGPVYKVTTAQAKLDLPSVFKSSQEFCWIAFGI
jgi:hypothetical protein